MPTKRCKPKIILKYLVLQVLDKGVGYGLRLYNFDSGQFKDFIQGRLSISAGDKGSWNVYKNIDRECWRSICAEQKIEHKDKKGKG